MPSEVEQAWRAIYRAHTRLAPTIDQRMKVSIDLTYSEYDALSTLKASGNPIKMTDLASCLAVSRTHVSRLVQSLEARGLAKRTKDPNDDRISLLEITGEGEQRLEEAGSFMRLILGNSIGKSLSDGELRQLTALAQRALSPDER